MSMKKMGGRTIARKTADEARVGLPGRDFEEGCRVELEDQQDRGDAGGNP